ncbi:MAG: rubrerythrin family protein [Oscillospiraceae bacterium]|nr:rubrerythrin family protein [Oscillospiraceae bacterium]
MEEISCAASYTAPGPYPEVRAGERNQRYGQAMLSNVGGSVSEMGAIARYLYGHVTQEGRPEIAECFHHIAVVEMHHLAIFSELARQLGEDPRLWSPFRGGRRYWTPEYLRYPRKLEHLLRYALEEERGTIQKYNQQALWIRDGNILANLERIIADEQVHVQILTGLLESYCAQG